MKLTRRGVVGGTLILAAEPMLAPLARAASEPLSLAISTSIVALDPMMMTSGDEYIYGNLVFNGLTRIREDLTVQPDLAESWTHSDDLKQWTFRLRQGVKFHNGRELDSEDVAAFFKRIIDPKNAAPSRSNYTMVTNVTAPDRYSVTFDLSYPYGGFADIMADRQVKITPRDLVSELQRKPIGTGPFMFQSYTPGDRMVLVKNPDYFEKGLPKLDGIVIRVIPEPSVKAAALKSGDIDIIWNLPLEQVKPLGSDPDLRVESVATGSWDAAIMNNLIPPFNDVRVRRAFQMAIDKRDVVDLTLFGEGAPTISPIPPTSPFFAHDIVIPKADPAAARKLLAEAGHPDGVSITLILPEGRTQRERLGVTLQQLAKPAGFDIAVKRIPLSSYSAEVSGKAPFYIDGYFARPTVDTSTYPFLHTDGSWNETLWHYKDAKVDASLEAARQTADPEKQKAAYIAMQHALNDDPAGFFAYSVNYACAYRKSVQNVKTHPMMWFDLRYATKA
ncbi:MAG: ABC transporter substrate-binding protein [Hyphomicrobiales bacterium]